MGKIIITRAQKGTMRKQFKNFLFKNWSSFTFCLQIDFCFEKQLDFVYPCLYLLYFLWLSVFCWLIGVCNRVFIWIFKAFCRFRDFNQPNLSFVTVTILCDLFLNFGCKTRIGITMTIAIKKTAIKLTLKVSANISSV